MNFEAVCRSLNTVLADTYVLMLKTQNVHWNVTGDDFFEVHKLTEMQYGELFEAVDELAERIRSMGGKAPGTMKEFLELTRMREGAGGSTMEAMVGELYEANSKFASLLRGDIKEVGDDLGEPGTEDTYIARLKAHEKAAWMLAATIERKATRVESKASSNGVAAKSEAPKSEPVKKEAPKKETVKKETVKVESKPATPKKSKSKSSSSSKKKGRMSRNIGETG